MTFKITNAIRIISIIVLAVVFFISYAGLPDEVLLLLDDAGNPAKYIDKDYYFYGALILLILTNVLIYVLAIILNKSTKPLTQVMSTYIMALPITANIFFSVSLTFIAILNGQENFDYSSFAPFIYLSEGLFVIWIAAFLFSLVRSKKRV